jgi:leader peptidase (prepilin peptidase)/N-methyltransferase
VWGTLWAAAVPTAALVWTVALSVSDLRQRRLPDVLTLSAAAVVWGWCILDGRLWALTGALAWWALCTVPGKVSRRLRIGGGDAKLALSLGAVAAAVGGPVGWWIAVTVSSMVTLCLGLMPRGTRVDRRRLPHGPGMLSGTWLSVLLTM